jgi:hypothetical protein
METVNQVTTAKTGQEQGAEAVPQRKGGFVQGAVVAQGCCGESGSSSGCCGTTAQTTDPTAVIQLASQGSGCCSTPAQTAASTPAVQLASQGGCCGASTPQGDSASTASRCCG